MWRRFGKTALFATVLLQNKATMRAAMEDKYQDVPFILNAFSGSLLVLTAEGHFLVEDQKFESLKTDKWAVVRPVQDPSSENTPFFTHI